jgi:hypothetical protein
MSQKIEIVTEISEENGVNTVTIKMSTAAFELNVRIPAAQMNQLKKVPSTSWEAGALKLGQSANADVFWCADGDDFISVMIGHDDQTWDIAFQLPTSVIDDIFHSISIT